MLKVDRLSLGAILEFPDRARPNRDYILRLSRIYSPAVACLVSLIIVLSTYRYLEPWLLGALIGAYWVYQLANGWVQRNGTLFGQAYDSEVLQLARAFLIVVTITIFLLYVYHTPAYQEGASRHDSLWLFYTLAIFVASQYSSTRRWLPVLLLSMIGLLSAYIFSFGVTSFDGVVELLVRCAWLVLIGGILHVLMRSSDFRAANLRALHAIKLDLFRLSAGSTDIEVFRMITRAVANGFGYKYVNIFQPRLDQAGGLLCIASSERGRKSLARQRYVLPMDHGIIGHVAREGSEYFSNDITDDPYYFPHDAFPDTMSEFTIPLKAGGRTIAVLDIQHDHKNAFHTSDRSLISLIAVQFGALLDLKRRADFQQTVNTLSRSVASRYLSRHELSETLDEIALAAQEELGADLVVLITRNPGTGETALGARRGKFYDEAHVEQSINRQRELIDRFLLADKDFYLHEDVRQIDEPLFMPSEDVVSRGYEAFFIREKIISRATMRLVADIGCVGLMFLNFRNHQSFRGQEARFEIFAHLTAMTLQKALFEERKLRAEREAVAALLHNHVINKYLLPAATAAQSLMLDPGFNPVQHEDISHVYAKLEKALSSAQFLHRTYNTEVPEDLAADVNDVVNWAKETCANLKSARFEIVWHCDSALLRRLPPDVGRCFTDCYRELLLNARHGNPTRVELEFNTTDDSVIISYFDDGHGFGDSWSGTNAYPSGLSHLQNSVTQLYGNIEIASLDDGPRITIRLPRRQ